MDIEWTRCKELLISGLLNDPHKSKTWTLNNSLIQIFSTMFLIDRFNSRAEELFNRFSYRSIQRMYGQAYYRQCTGCLHEIANFSVRKTFSLKTKA